MDITTLGQLKEIGIALTAVGAFAYITKYVIDKNTLVFEKLTSQLEDVQKNYSAFVESNNHNNSERLEKSTEAITRSTEMTAKVAAAIEMHTRAVERLVDKIT